MAQKIASLYAEIGADTSGLDKGLAKTKSGLEHAGKEADKLGTRIGKFATGFGKFALETGVVALGAAFVSATKNAAELETEFGKLAALTDTPQAAIGDLRKEVMRLSTQLPVSALELSKALYFISSSGFQGAEAMDILNASATAATAGLGETQVIADAVTSAMNAYGKEVYSAARITDLLTFAVKQGKGEPDELAGSLGRVLPIASQAKVSMEDVAAAMAIMTRTGMNADEAATSLRGTIAALLAPAKQSVDALGAIGLTTQDVAAMLAKPGGLVNVLRTLQERTGGNVEQLDMIIPNIRALTGVLSLAGSQGEEYARVLMEAYKAEGLTADAAAIMGDKTEAKLKKAQNAAENLGTTISNKLLPILGDAADAANLLITGQEKIDAAFTETSKTIARNAPTYENYKQQIIGIGIAAKKITESDILSYQEEVARGFMTEAEAAEALRIKLGMLSDSEFWNVKATEAAATATQYLSDRTAYFKGLADEASKANEGAGYTAIKTADELKKEAKAAQEAAEALGEAKVSWLEYIEGFKEFDAASLLQLQIDQLKQAIESTGDPTGNLTSKLLDLERQAGNITPKAEAAQEAYAVLSEMFMRGYLTSSNLEAALRKLETASDDGTVDIKELGLSASEARTYMLYLRDGANEATEAIKNIPRNVDVDVSITRRYGGAIGDGTDSEPPPSTPPTRPSTSTTTPTGGRETMARGGMVYPGRSYLVGENQAEYLNLYNNGSGYITPVVGAQTHSDSGVTIHAPITINGAQNPKATAEAVGRYLGGILDQRLRTR